MLAHLIIAGLATRHKTAIALVEEGLQVDTHLPVADYAALHETAIRLPYSAEGKHYDFLILEHLVLPDDIAARKGDLIIRLEHAA